MCLHTGVYPLGVLPLRTQLPNKSPGYTVREVHVEKQGALAEFPVEKSHLSYPSQHYVEERLPNELMKC